MAASRILRRYRVRHGDLNRYGRMHGGRMLTLADELGYLAAHAHTECDCLTLAAHHGRFLAPAKEGERLLCCAVVAAVGRRSVWVPVRFRTLAEDIFRIVMVYVAVDARFRPVRVPPVRPSTAEERAMMEAVSLLRRQVQSLEQTWTPF